MLVPLTTNSYASPVPGTDLGRAVTLGAMIFGVLFLSMPLAIVGQNFTAIWDDRERIVFIEKVKDTFIKDGDVTAEALAEAFEKIDFDGSGTITRKELRLALRGMGMRLGDVSLAQLWHAIDHDKSGEIDQHEFIKLFFDDGGQAAGMASPRTPSPRAPSKTTSSGDSGGGGGGGGKTGGEEKQQSSCAAADPFQARLASSASAFASADATYAGLSDLPCPRDGVEDLPSPRGLPATKTAIDIARLERNQERMAQQLQNIERLLHKSIALQSSTSAPHVPFHLDDTERESCC